MINNNLPETSNTMDGDSNISKISTKNIRSCYEFDNKIIYDNDLEEHFKKSKSYDIFKIKIKNFKLKAKKHIGYLKSLMFIIVIILSEFKILTDYQILYISIIIIFNIAFTQNLLNNLPRY